MIVHVQAQGRDGSPETVVRRVGSGYGETPELALELLEITPMHAERPILLDVHGELLEFEPGAVRRWWSTRANTHASEG